MLTGFKVQVMSAGVRFKLCLLVSVKFQTVIAINPREKLTYGNNLLA